MRILQISSAGNFGGGERHLVDLCRSLTARGHDVFVALRAANRWRDKLDFLTDENILYLPLRNSLDVWSARGAAKFIERKKVEIVHAHLARDYPIAALAARQSKAELVLTRHLLFPLGFPHKMVLPKNAVFVAVAKGVRRQLLKQNVLPPERVRLIYNGVDIKRFKANRDAAENEKARRRFDLKTDCRLVGIVGEITAHKGQTDFVRAAREVLKKLPETEFLIVGQDGSPQKKHQKRLADLIAELKLENKIHLVGWLEDVAPALAALDVFVSASLVEPFGLAIVEAMVSGCAVVATETDGASEIIDDGATGKLVPIENHAALAEAIIEVLSDETLRANLSANAIEAASEKFGIERMAAQTEEIYRELAEAR